MKPRPYSRPYTDTVFAPLAERVAEIEAAVHAILDDPIAPDLSHRLHARAALRHVQALRAALAAGDAAEAAHAALQLGAEAGLLHAAPWIDTGAAVVEGGREGARRRSPAHPAENYQAALEAEFQRAGDTFKLTATQARLARRFKVCLKTIQRHTTDPRTGS